METFSNFKDASKEKPLQKRVSPYWNHPISIFFFLLSFQLLESNPFLAGDSADSSLKENMSKLVQKIDEVSLKLMSN